MSSNANRSRKQRANKALPKRGAARDRPSWHAQKRELRFRGRLLKRYKRSAPQPECILAAFQHEGWAAVIQTPFPHAEGQNRKVLVKRVVDNLNRGLDCKLVQFLGLDGGQKLGWRPR